MTTTQPAAATHSLFALLNQADAVCIDHMESDCDGVGFYFGDDRKVYRISGHGEPDYHFLDQQVSLLSGGEVVAETCHKDADEPATSHTLQLKVRIERPLIADDLIDG